MSMAPGAVQFREYFRAQESAQVVFAGQEFR